MILKDFIDLYDNWNGVITINDDNLNCIICDKINNIVTLDDAYLTYTVVAFGFYDNELCVRVRP